MLVWIASAREIVRVVSSRRTLHRLRRRKYAGTGEVTRNEDGLHRPGERLLDQSLDNLRFRNRRARRDPSPPGRASSRSREASKKWTPNGGTLVGRMCVHRE